MKRNSCLFFFSSLVFLLSTAMSCEEDDYKEKLIGIEIYNMDNAGKEIIPADESVKKEAFVLGVKLFSIVSSTYKSMPDEWSKPTLSSKMEFVNAEGDAKVLANTDFNANYPQGSDISHLFDIYWKTSDHNKPEPPFDVYTYFLILKEAPDAGEHSFKIVYGLKDNEGNIAFDSETILLN